MYVACVPLNVQGRKVKPGEHVPEADKWQECVIRAHINLEWIKKVDGAPADHYHKEPVQTGAEVKEDAAPSQPKKKRARATKQQ